MRLQDVYRIIEDGVYPRVEGVARPQLFICPSDFKLEDPLVIPVPILKSRLSVMHWGIS